MGFDIDRFMSHKFSPRTEDVPVPDLKSFFAEGEPAVITVRSLTGEELARAAEHVEKYRAIGKLIESFVSGKDAEKIAAIKESMGITDKVPEDFAKRLQMLVIGSVNPKFAQDQAVKLAKNFPIEFYSVTNAIIRLTGQGSLPGESAPSTAVTT
jgi:hypothetical protein